MGRKLDAEGWVGELGSCNPPPACSSEFSNRTLLTSAMDIRRRGEMLYNLRFSQENSIAEARGLLEGLSEEQRREVVRYQDKVRE